MYTRRQRHPYSLPKYPIHLGNYIGASTKYQWVHFWPRFKVKGRMLKYRVTIQLCDNHLDLTATNCEKLARLLLEEAKKLRDMDFEDKLIRDKGKGF